MHAPVDLADLPPVGSKPERARWPSAAFPFSRLLLASICALLAAFVGYLDYLTGYEQSLLLFYLVSIAVAVWFGGLYFGLGFSIFSVVVWVVSDLLAGIGMVSFWNLGMALSAYVLFTFMLSKLRTLLLELEDRVRERTKALRREIAERERLDREISTVADRERRRIGQELHDSVCQHLTGTALAAQSLRDRLEHRSAPEVQEADKVIDYIEQGIDLSRNLARGFFSPELDAEGLAFALKSLASNMTERFQIPCSFSGEETVRVADSTVATQLYRIAQEAVMNAIKHAEAKSISIALRGAGRDVTLTVQDNGVGLPTRLPEPPGLGLRLMSHGAALIGAEFNISRNPGGGTTVACKVPMQTEVELG
ncbi:MAG TPA: sensor histidine kinase [Chthoniobacterales bacterium]|nr:sensor histidine kinase [Chthoniobacterales bacterium]